MEFKDTKIRVVEVTKSEPMGDNKKKPTKIKGEDGITYSSFHDSADGIKAGDLIQASGRQEVKGKFTNTYIDEFTILENAPKATSVINNVNNGTDWERKDELAHRRAVMDTLIQTGNYHYGVKDIKTTETTVYLNVERLAEDFEWAMGLIYGGTVKPPLFDIKPTTTEEEPKTALQKFVRITTDAGWGDDDRARFIHGIHPKLQWKELTQKQKDDLVTAVTKYIADNEDIPF